MVALKWYGSAKPSLAELALDATSGILFLGTGLVSRIRRPDNPVGWLLIAIGFAFLLRTS
jgi:hypothetical protein